MSQTVSCSIFFGEWEIGLKWGLSGAVVCLSPGNIGMRPGLKVSQMMNIAFDMAQWVLRGDSLI